MYKLLNIQFAKYHMWNNKSEGFPNMVLSTETFNQSVRTEYSEAVNLHYTFQPLWVSLMSRNAHDDKNGRFGERAARLTILAKLAILAIFCQFLQISSSIGIDTTRVNIGDF